MSKKLNPEMVDEENPEWTAEMLSQSVRFHSLPESLRVKLDRPPRGPQRAPVKVSTTIRLSPDAIDAFKSSGDEWQTRIDSALKGWLRTHSLV